MIFIPQLLSHLRFHYYAHNYLGLLMISAFLCTFISTVHASSLCFLGFSGSNELGHFPPLKFLFFFSVLAFLSKMTKRAKRVPEPASPSDSNSTSMSSSVPSSSPAPPPPTSFYKSLYRWCSGRLTRDVFARGLSSRARAPSFCTACVYLKKKVNKGVPSRPFALRRSSQLVRNIKVTHPRIGAPQMNALKVV